jgi:effector-binding domain-containing protein
MAVDASFPFPETDTIKARVLPAGDAIATVHVGPRERVADAVAALAAWRAANGRASAGPHWEIHVDDPSRTPPDQTRIELVEPLS